MSLLKEMAVWMRPRLDRWRAGIGSELDNSGRNGCTGAGHGSAIGMDDRGGMGGEVGMGEGVGKGEVGMAAMKCNHWALNESTKLLGIEHKDWLRGLVPPEVKEEGDLRVKCNIFFHAWLIIYINIYRILLIKELYHFAYSNILLT